MLKNIGPGTLVAAAFIGPGTVTVCSLAGVSYGFTLLWAMLLSIVATLVLQEMAMRLGLVTKKGLAKNVQEHILSKGLRWIALLLILSAILVGNAAYEAGNISGGAEEKRIWKGIKNILRAIGEHRKLRAGQGYQTRNVFFHPKDAYLSLTIDICKCSLLWHISCCSGI